MRITILQVVFKVQYYKKHEKYLFIIVVFYHYGLKRIDKLFLSF